MKPATTSSIRPLITYLVLTFAFSSVFHSLIISAGRIGGGYGLYVTGLMWCPGLAAIVTTLLSGRKLSSLGWKWG
ncbi:MAG: hypothetical protein JST09_15420, partial [Bacteroidetes bacterium]|nr:hypothetical protein [Bacteroidota bacterium]